MATKPKRHTTGATFVRRTLKISGSTSGTNHTLPTNGWATAYSGVNLDAFCRKITYQHITPEGIGAIGHTVELMAEAESLDAHRNAMTLRVLKCKNS